MFDVLKPHHSTLFTAATRFHVILNDEAIGEPPDAGQLTGMLPYSGSINGYLNGLRSITEISSKRC